MDAKLLFVILGTGNFLILALLIAYRKTNTDPAIHYHLLSLVMMVISYVFAVTRLVNPLRVFIILNTVPLIVGSYFEAKALASISDVLTPRMDRILAVIMAAGILAYTGHAVFFDFPYIRIVILSATTLLLAAYPTISVLKKRSGSALRLLLGVLFLLICVSSAIRLADGLRLREKLVLFGPAPGEIAMFIMLYMYMIIGGMGVILLAKEKTDARLILLAYHDGYTGTLNRDGFIDSTTRAIGECAYRNEAFSVILIDIDDMDGINEAHGYETGNRIILRAAELLRGEIRSPDFVGRFGGDEFMVFLKGIDRLKFDGVVARIKSALEGAAPEGIRFSASIGAVTFDYPAGRQIDFPLIHDACYGAVKEAKKHGSGGGSMALT